jgi:hypothetical protein
MEDYILQLLTRLEDMEEQQQRGASSTTPPRNSGFGDRVKPFIPKMFCLRRSGRSIGKQAYDSAAAKKRIVVGLKRVKRTIREGEITQIRAAHLEGCLGAMKGMVEGCWDDTSPPERIVHV